MPALADFQVADWLQEHPILAQVVGLSGLVLVGFVVLWLVRVIAVPLVTKAVQKSRFKWDDAFVQSRFLQRASNLFPAVVVWLGVDLLREHLQLDETAHTVVKNAGAAVVALCAMLAVVALLTSANLIWSQREDARHRPIKGYVELGKIFVWVVGGIVAVAALLGQPVWPFLTGIGAMTAVLLLIFKDTILSLVASLQLTSNDMVRLGDWIEMPSVGADGDVIDIALHTVKVQNWDKTVSTIPTYRLVSDSFRNWRGMQESGGRRLKRNLLIDVSTIRFLTKRDMDRMAKVDVLKEYIEGKRAEIEATNEGRQKGEPATNLRQLTNVGTFRAYVVHYLKRNPQVRDDMTFLVRQLQPGPTGLPLEIYLFTKTTAWAEYEAIQADIFDHLLAVLPEFGLRAYQQPSGADLQALTPTKSG